MVVIYNYLLKMIIQYLGYFFSKLLGGVTSPIKNTLEVFTITLDNSIKDKPKKLINDLLNNGFFIIITPF